LGVQNFTKIATLGNVHWSGVMYSGVGYNCTVGWGIVHCTVGWGIVHCTVGWGIVQWGGVLYRGVGVFNDAAYL